MKILRTLAAILFFIGFMMIAGAIGADDLAVELHQAHTLDITSILVGMICCVPIVVVYGVL